MSSYYAQPATRARPEDTAEQVAQVAHARREAMLRAYRKMLRPEDLEDCLSQAVCELLARSARGRRYESREHVAHALEQRFLSRVYDRRRALHGRSPMQAALEHALPLNEQWLELADPRSEPHGQAARREQLRLVVAVAPLLSRDQRLVLACQLAGIERAAFCRRFEWSHEKYRKVAQRARARLRRLVEEAGARPAGTAVRSSAGAPVPSAACARVPSAAGAPVPSATGAHSAVGCRIHPAPSQGVGPDDVCVPPSWGGRNREIGTHL